MSAAIKVKVTSLYQECEGKQNMIERLLRVKRTEWRWVYFATVMRDDRLLWTSSAVGREGWDRMVPNAADIADAYFALDANGISFESLEERQWREWASA